MLITADNPRRLLGIDIGIFEEPHTELPFQHWLDQLVELRFLQVALLDQFDEMQIAIRFGKLDVDARGYSELASFFLVLGDRVAANLGPEMQLRDGVIIGYHKTLE